jgi:CRP/FNR family transcriptional regulator, cyclic AMP receptor protein
MVLQASADVRAALQQHIITRGLEPADLDRLAEVAKPVEWQAGQPVFREGDRDDFLYLMTEGRVALEINVPSRGRVRILTIGSGDVLGWSSVYYQRPKAAKAIATELSRALALDAGRLRELSENDCGFGYRLTLLLLQVVSDRLKATRLQLLDVFKT